MIRDLIQNMVSWNNEMNKEYNEVKILKNPVLNIFLGSFPIVSRGLYDFRYPQYSDIQLLQLLIDEKSTESKYSSVCGIYTLKSNDLNSLKDLFNSNLPELINEICINAKQYQYQEKSKLSVNLIMSSSNELYKFADELIIPMCFQMKKAFINGITISIFNIYKENFHIKKAESYNNIKFITYVNSLKPKYLKLIDGIYFLSNYDNDEIYTKEYMEKMLFHIFLYIDIKHFSVRYKNNKFSDFSEKEFIFLSNCLENDINIEKAKNCFSIGAIQLLLPEEYIKKIIQLCIYKYNLRDVDIDDNRAFAFLKINNQKISSDGDSCICDINIEPLKKVKNRFRYHYTIIEKINAVYDIDSFKNDLLNELSTKLEAFKSSKYDELNNSLCLFMLENEISIFQLSNLIKNSILPSLKQTKAIYIQEHTKRKKALNDFEYTKLKHFLPIKLRNKSFVAQSVFLNKIESIKVKKLVVKWKNFYLQQVRAKMFLDMYCYLIDFFEEIIQNGKKALNLYKNIIDKCQDEMFAIEAKMNKLQLNNTIDYYCKTTNEMLSNICLIDYTIDDLKISSFSEGFFEKIVYQIEKNTDEFVNKIYSDFIGEKNYFSEYKSRLDITKREDIYVDILNFVIAKNPINLRIIDNEKLNKKICVCFPLNYNISEEFIDARNSNKEFNTISFVKTNSLKEVMVLYINGNIDINDIYHF